MKKIFESKTLKVFNHIKLNNSKETFINIHI